MAFPRTRLARVEARAPRDADAALPHVAATGLDSSPQ